MQQSTVHSSWSFVPRSQSLIASDSRNFDPSEWWPTKNRHRRQTDLRRGIECRVPNQLSCLTQIRPFRLQISIIILCKSVGTLHVQVEYTGTTLQWSIDALRNVYRTILRLLKCQSYRQDVRSALADLVGCQLNIFVRDSCCYRRQCSS